jgi:bifunctional DNA-binding transcriptional regulator/antitoxin component of YhaV-PrlF toxin-antitoxin module
MIRRLAGIAIAICLPLAAKPPKAAMPAVTTESVEFAPGGAIQVSGSVGELNIEGWDRPEVEITVTRSTYRTDAPRERQLAQRQLSAIKVTAERKSPTELAIHTALPPRGFWARVARCPPGVQIDYRIRVPRDSRLVLRLAAGDVLVYDVSGDIDAAVRTGDIVMQLPAAGQYSFDARCRFGGVYSDFAGNYHIAHMVSERFAQNGPPPAKRVHLRVGIGGIKIQKMG